MVLAGLLKKNEQKLEVAGELFPFISATGNNDVVDSNELYREDEKKDERIGRIVTLLNAKQDWTEFAWEVEALPPTVELSDSEEDEENVEVEDVTDIHVEEPAVVARRGKHKLNDPATKEKGKCKVDESVVPPTVLRSPRQGRKNLSQSSTHGEPSPKKEEMGTKEYFQDALGNLSQILHKVSIPHKKRVMKKHLNGLLHYHPLRLEIGEHPLSKIWNYLRTGHLKIGPSMYTTELAERVMGPAVWLNNHLLLYDS
ncbi:hypothetical protein Bca52824_082681 [Brassica carinata]|uniref:Uncharacterized protein n=1 Tax=Brassica carinata TaxID=52824 RepID=A0A8X7PJL2_BRACI|nr:hypothetical protein Bca52824_082681 [Brassica carinata]